MTAVTGPPARLAERRADLTPMLQQYVDRCSEYDDALVLFRVGDFYKTFCGIAEEVARICELTLIEREDSTGTYAAAGIPVDNAASYIERLLDAGHRVAIADQVEDPAEASGIVDRAVTQVITPGTVVDDDLLSPDSTYVASVVADDADLSRYGVASVDVSTGECSVTSVGDPEAACEELDRIAPAELLVGPDTAEFDDGTASAGAVAPTTTDWRPEAFDTDAARERVDPYTDPDRLDAAQLRALGGLLAYAEYTQGDDGVLEYVSRVRRYDPRDHLRLDAAALQSLELFENRGARAATREGDTLFSVLDETVCALGRRRLEEWVRRPLVDRQQVEARLDAVDELATRPLLREELRDHLRTAYDLERLVARVSRGRANARDLRSLHTTLTVVPDLKDALDEAESGRLTRLKADLDELTSVRELVADAVREDPPQELTEGGVVRDGFDDELDDLRATAREGREWVANLEREERERTGIENLDVGHNQVHGYYIEVTNGQLDNVPDEYRRRQTLKNSERFVTPELKRREDEIFGAEERANALEYEVFCEVREDVAEATVRIQALAEALSTLDALCSLATVAVERDYVRPRLHDGSEPLEIEGGRHPVVERTESEFVPNDAVLADGDVAIITGPNMSGKSTYMRQVGLCVVLAQVGSFVPAQAASLPVMDRVFTRVGASDDIAGGQSTFMREMSELTDILHDATPDSLVLLDEVGRGTATVDGLAIARAATEFLHDRVGARTLFATHYHDLTALADEKVGVHNLHFTATREGTDVTFLHRVADGPSSSSYGIEVARMAGVPEDVVDRARDLVDEGAVGPDQSSHPGQQTLPEALGGEERYPDPIDSQELRVIVEELCAHDLAQTTPLEALNLLHDYQARIEELW
jgi:DNA mismatch repair protein MutS